MTTIPGASQFLGAATLANSQGTAAVQSTVLGESSATSLLDVGRSGLFDNGIGLSASPESGLARSLVLEADDGSVAEGETGQTIDTEA